MHHEAASAHLCTRAHQAGSGGLRRARVHSHEEVLHSPRVRRPQVQPRRPQRRRQHRDILLLESEGGKEETLRIKRRRIELLWHHCWSVFARLSSWHYSSLQGLLTSCAFGSLSTSPPECQPRQWLLILLRGPQQPSSLVVPVGKQPFNG